MNSSVVRQLLVDVQNVITLHPGLSVDFNKSFPKMVHGNYVVIDDKGIVQGNFDIKVIIPEAYPYSFPTLIETSNKIPRELDCHMFPGGEACIENKRKIEILKRKGVSLTFFFEEYVHRFLCWQLVYDHDKGASELPGWGHGMTGIREYYQEVLGTKDQSFIKDVIRRILSGQLPGRNKMCFCNSNIKFKRCHEAIIQDLTLIEKAHIEEDLRLWDS